MGGHFKIAVFENRCIILVKIFAVMGCLKRTRVPATYNTILRTYIKFIIVFFVLFFAEHELNVIKSNKLFCCGS
jgi:large-conductance mechanosensitive channel